MPEHEGMETIKDLKRDYPDVKIIAISGTPEVNRKATKAEGLIAKQYVESKIPPGSTIYFNSILDKVSFFKI